MAASSLIHDYLDVLRAAARLSPVLDLACGAGRNGLPLVRQGIPVVFADNNPEAMERVRWSLERPACVAHKHLARLWEVDFEQENSRPLEPDSFGAILVFRYLHRPLMPQINRAVKPGGLVIYETFTTRQAQLGRPKNPDYLLNPGELATYFSGWEILHEFEGETVGTESGKPQAVARLVARKPAS
jgi:SAM-dependent methyltransferase